MSSLLLLMMRFFNMIKKFRHKLIGALVKAKTEKVFIDISFRVKLSGSN